MSSRPVEDLTGQIFGRLVVLRKAPSIGDGARWLCRCECGTEKPVRAGNLRGGNTISCGCHCAEQKRLRKTHGKRLAPEYNVWSRIKQRCLNPDDTAYKHYGARGITVDPGWAASFEAFYASVGDRPGKGYSLNRINNDGNYEPGNCEWATDKEQQRNTRGNHVVEFNGRRQCMSAWAEEMGLPRNLLSLRILRLKWSVEEALTTPPQGFGDRTARRLAAPGGMPRKAAK